MTGASREFDRAPPGASAMMESLRGIGYSTPSAVADLIDNSISAGAKRVRVDFIWRGADSCIRVLDDGRGMSGERLIEAMRPASQHPLLPRPADDLGRFGLGLKTASLSQGRLLVVTSRVAEGTDAARTWDLDHVAETDDWQLLRDVPSVLAADAVIPTEQTSGTAVVIAHLDRMLGTELTGSQLDRQKFLDAARRVERHLGMTFHRYLEGPSPKLAINFNGDDDANRVPPWDPFMRAHAATTPTPVEWMRGQTGGIEVQGFVLPHKDRLTSAEFALAEGPGGWQAHEGFFVYRGERLLVPGGWLGLGPGRGWASNGVHRLARLRLDLPPSGDHDWKVDIRKSSATPPPALRNRLQTLAEAVRRDAREVFAQRTGTGRRQQRPVLRAWTPVHDERGTTYKVDRSHPTVRQALDAVGSHRRLVEDMLTVIEATVPVQRIWMDVAERSEVASETAASMSMEERTALHSLYRHMRVDLKLQPDIARARVMTVEPFSGYPDEVSGLPDEPR
jgi:hypothetical protein